ncbi:uncharacterized protein LOC116408248 [Xenopus tropicalis]|uniref:Uncharacterized protein LOC116408248 n=1 Tax=Xenopus tropicalis TaxID=8364 RepID=A0A8J1J2F6_XENTR|nr:uncharacterized protein LOC116408248 [Xenopus tropicalis]
MCPSSLGPLILIVCGMEVTGSDGFTAYTDTVPSHYGWSPEWVYGTEHGGHETTTRTTAQPGLSEGTTAQLVLSEGTTAQSGLSEGTTAQLDLSEGTRGKTEDTGRTRWPALGKPQFTQFPINNNNNTLKWRLSETHEALTGYQLNMVAWKEHTVIEEESQRLPPNVMEHRIPMEPGSSYMVTVRALTAAGPGEASLWLSGTPKATGASDSYVRVSLVLKPLFLTVLILILLCVTVREKWEQRGAGAKRHRRDTGRGGSEEMAPL